MANLNILATRDRTLDAFNGKMIGGGTRSNLLEVELYFPDEAIPQDSTKDILSDKARFLVKAAALPASNISNIAVPFRGRNLKIAGDRTFDPWTITVINDNAGITDPTGYQQDLFVRQLGRSEVAGTNPVSSATVPVLKQYKFLGAFPTLVSAIDLSYENTDAIEEFTVELQYQWYDALDSSGQTQLGTGS